MKLPLKLGRSSFRSPSSSTQPSPAGTPCASPSPLKKKRRFSFPALGSLKWMAKPEPVGAGTVRTSASSPLPSSQAPPRDKGEAIQLSECNSALSSPAASTSLAGAQNGMLELKQVFAQFDANGDGRISAEELQAVLESLGQTTTMEEAAMMVQEVDVDGDGFIDLEEFVQMSRWCVAESALEEEMVAAFSIFDSEETGRITAEGLQQVLQRLGGSLAQRSSVEECRQMISGVDRKGVGHVDFEDFKRLMTPLIF